MISFDSHAHFPGDAFAEHRAQIARAREAGLCGILAVGGSPDLDPGAIAMAREHPGDVHLALGCDRDTAPALAPDPATLDATLRRLRATLADLARDGIAVRAIGEIGLDFSRNPSAADKAAQIALFDAQLALADELDLPCTIHSRDADAETLASLERHASPSRRRTGSVGVLHCFTREADFAAALIDLGLCIGLSGILTFRNADPLRAVAAGLPHERILVETDCPYLTPVPMRGRPNEPAMLPHTVRRLAKILGLDESDAADLTTANARRLFQIDP
ncbi:MAG: TatD family hydrolase [Kiritimatiellia bacterium]|jgi:TatD DNase family protein